MPTKPDAPVMRTRVNESWNQTDVKRGPGAERVYDKCTHIRSFPSSVYPVALQAGARAYAGATNARIEEHSIQFQ